ncbi:hypothetical protein UC35_13205 [Ramlibacter tataouinensis]|uniref:Uncharacterized protein n=2 Tax=Ramlibacter tataouinensis TaxID=94132 RepID=A0A127JUI9_9BURK|nr:hypothetical protein UC35_13205 [Ramlibacter tataouinensis]
MSDFFDLFKIPSEQQVRLSEILTAGRVDAPVAAGDFPLLVFCHGGGLYREQSTVLMEHLASLGFVVASVAHPHEAGSYVTAEGEFVTSNPTLLADLQQAQAALTANTAWCTSESLAERLESLGRLIRPLRSSWLGKLANVWADDMVFTADQILEGSVGLLAKSLKPDVGYFGMSYGAHAAALATMKDVRTRAFVNLDGGLFTAEPLRRVLGVPVLCLTEDMSTSLAMTAMMGRQLPSPTEESLGMLHACYTHDDGTPDKRVHHVSIRGAAHGDFSDLPLLFGSIPGFVCFPGGIRVLEIQKGMVGAFFSRFMSGRDEDFQTLARARFPDEVVIHDARRTI